MRQAKTLLAAGALLLIVAASGGGASAQTDAGAYVRDLAHKVLAIFDNPQVSRERKEQLLYPIAVNAFDVPRIARFALGRFWKDASPQQRDDFTRAFERYMVHFYAGVFDLYHDVDFQIVTVRPEETRTLVRSRIVQHNGRPPVAVDWWVTRSGDTYRIVDVNIEGASQLLALREQFAAVIDQQGGSVAALIAHLREKTER